MEGGNKIEMEEQLLYKDLARYYDLIYSFKDYAKEAERIAELIRQFKKSNGNDLLEVACGTGKHLDYLRRKFRCMGTDINEGILGVARQKLPDIELQQADMVNMDLGRQFDVITCLFSSIGYVKTYDNLQKTLDGFARHLKPGGVVIIEPWFTKEVYKVGNPHMTTYDGPDVKIARLNISEADGNISVMDMYYLIAEKGKGVSHFVERHEMGMFDIDRTLELMRKTGLEAQLLKDDPVFDRGLLIGVKQ